MNTLLLSPDIWFSLRLQWLWVYRGAVPLAGEWSDEIAVPAGWFWVEAGLVKIRVEGREVVIRPGDGFFTAPGTRRQWFAEGTRLMSVGLRSDWPDGSPLFKSGLNVRQGTRASLPLKAATEALFAAVHPGREEMGYREAVAPAKRSLPGWSVHEAAFQSWFSVYLGQLRKMGVAPQPRSGKDARLARVLKRLEAWPLGESLKLGRLAAGSPWSERRLHDLLRDQLGMTAQAWLERRKLEAAKQRLATEDTALKEIAYQLGFRHPPHFTTWFKRHAGLNPMAYRAMGGVGGA
ncbi:MAG: HTH-type transcriptional activator RhaS [Prosthecobacter sp.]|nr:HTH-type transcriptional activator RhaS [Prosthecobacter sp.]